MRDDCLINARLQEAFGSQLIENLPLPLAVQATCARSGAGVLLREGSLASALRASMALPFLFAPHTHGGRLLVDGSLSDPLPLAGAPDQGVVVALGFRVPRPRQLSSASRLATQITATLSNNLLDSQLNRADTARTVLLMPELDRRVGLFDTDAMPYLLQLGRESAQAALPGLRALLLAQTSPPAGRAGYVCPTAPGGLSRSESDAPQPPCRGPDAMIPTHWQTLQPHLDAVLDAPVAEREALIAQLRSQDPVLAAELEALLRGAHGRRAGQLPGAACRR